MAILSAESSAADPAPNQQVARFCQDNLGKKVGEGECADLASEALRGAGAKLSRDYTDDPNKGDYVWGTRLVTVEANKGKIKVDGKLTDAKPGDIIQYRNALFQGRILPKGKYSVRATHHTAVLMAVSPKGRAIHVWEQNRNGEKKVAVAEMQLGDLKDGWLRIYRPEAKTQ